MVCAAIIKCRGTQEGVHEEGGDRLSFMNAESSEND